MSQYRDDRSAARHRIESLEASVAERDAELAQREAALADRDEEIARLERELERAGVARPRRASAANAAMASKVVAVSTAIVTAALGLTAMRMSAAAPAPAALFLPPAMPAAMPQGAPIHADPLVGSHVDWQAHDTQGTAASPDAISPAAPREPIDFRVWSPDRPPPPDETAIRRALEPKVRSGRASTDEIKMLKAVCSHQGDRACRNMAAAALEAHVERARQGDPMYDVR